MSETSFQTHTPGVRILVIGGSGSGKSTLARAVAEELSIFDLTLDWIGYQPDEFGRLPSFATLEATARAMARGTSWVVEGAFVGWTRPLAERAHLILWLDVPLRVALWRIFWRHVKAEIRRNNRHPGWWKLVKFMRAVKWQYQSDPRALDSRIPAPVPSNFEAFAAEYRDKTVRIRSMSVDEVVAELNSRAS